MFTHNLKYTLKILFKNKILIFWTFAFPIILGTLFNMAFADIEKNEQLNTLDIAIIKTNEFKDSLYETTFKNLSQGDKPMFNIKYTDEQTAIEWLQNKEISGYLIVEEDERIVINQNGIEATILKQVVDEIKQTKKMLQNVPNQSQAKDIYFKVMNNVESPSNIKNITRANLSYTMIEFYTLIAMTCLYGGILGMYVVNQNLANMSSNGKRVSITPIKKIKIILSSVLASYIAQLIGLVLLFLYTVCFLKIDYGDNWLLVFLLSLLGSLAGLTFGIAIAAIFRTNENNKTGIIIAFTMLCCFLSGMMGISMKYIVDKHTPIINKLNPANMITDGFYSLYYYDTLDRFYFNIISLAIFSLIMITISLLSLRRQKYDSI